MNITVVTPPPFQPVSVEEAYLHLRWDEDGGSPTTYPLQSLIERNIATATAYVEQFTRRALVEQTIRLSIEGFPNTENTFSREYRSGIFSARPMYIELFRPPLVNVVAVEYYDEDNALQTVAASNYFVTDDLVPRLTFVENWNQPQTYNRDDAVRVTYQVGYEPTSSPPTTQEDYAANIPAGIKDAILLKVQLLCDRFDKDERKDIERSIASLLSSYTIQGFSPWHT